MPKRTLKRNKKPRNMTVGFRKRSSTKNGRRVLRKRRLVGRKRLTSN